jgi:hemerythrin HHE cation binding domain-containing protein
MKRSAALAPLSRDHHVALEVALRLRRATDATLEQAIMHFLDFWARQGEHHFVVEERIVLLALPDDDAEWTSATRRVRDEHAEIRDRASTLPAGPSLDASHGLGALLRAHVRYEERELFPLLEERLSGDALVALGRALIAAEPTD